MVFFRQPCVLACLFAIPMLGASAQRFSEDPANLRGERVQALDGRELPVDQGARGLEQALRRLRTRASLMMIVAHPDDEDGGMLTLVSRGLGARAADLSLTRGEGGQNAMTGDFEDALGLLRTQELLAADRYSGVDQFFGTEVDFGFSKTQEETFARWTHERVLYDAVRAVRLYRPLVIASVWIGGVTDGHGHHQVSGVIAQEVFKAAGDPQVFPDQIAQGLEPWQPLKVYARVPTGAITAKGLFDYATNQYTPAQFKNYVTGDVTASTPTVNLIVHEGAPDPLLVGLELPGRKTVSYVQFARTGLALQKSQVGGAMRTPPAGTWDVGYHRYGSKLAVNKDEEQSFFDGIDTSVVGIATLTPEAPAYLTQGLAEFSAGIEQATRAFKPNEPTTIAPILAATQLRLLALLSQVQDSKLEGKQSILHELKVKQVQLNEALRLAMEVSLDASANSAAADVVAGTPLPLRSTLTTGLPAVPLRETVVDSRGQAAELDFASTLSRRLSATPASFAAAPCVPAEPMAAERPLVCSLSAPSAVTSIVTRPPFHRASIEAPSYKVDDPALRLAPSGPAALTAWATVRYEGVPVTVGRIVHAGAQPVSFVPALSVALGSHAQVLPAAEDQLRVRVSVAPSGARLEQESLHTPAGWRSEFFPATGEFRVRPPAIRLAATLTAEVTTPDGKSYSEGYRAVGYGDLPRTNLFTPASLRVVPVDLKLPVRRRIGYLPGTGDSVAEDLRTVGLEPVMLTVADLTPASLQRFDSVVLGVRTYAAHPDLHGAPTQALLDYAAAGGNVIVQYQTAEFGAADAPFPLTLGRDAEKVVDETDPVTLSASPVLLAPNRLRAADFDGWVEERGHGFLRTWDPRYTTPTEVHDPGQEPQRGGLVMANVGRGHWSYVAFALYRQMPEAVPGAFRMFANLLALSEK